MNEYQKILNKSTVKGVVLKAPRSIGKSIIIKELSILNKVYKHYNPKLILGECLIDDKLKFTQTNNKQRKG